MPADKHKGIISNYLVASFDMEDKMSERVYGQYLDRTLWPEDLSDEAFAAITNLLNSLIAGTNQHKKMLSVLSDDLDL